LKIWFHFKYLKATNNKVKNSNFLYFVLDLTNLLRVFVVMAPVFFGKKQNHHERDRKLVLKSVYVFWLIFAAIILFAAFNNK